MVNVGSVTCTLPRMMSSKSIIRIGTAHTTGLPTYYFIAAVMIRCTVPMTRAIRLRSCMIGNGHDRFAVAGGGAIRFLTVINNTWSPDMVPADRLTA